MGRNLPTYRPTPEKADGRLRMTPRNVGPQWVSLCCRPIDGEEPVGRDFSRRTKDIHFFPPRSIIPGVQTPRYDGVISTLAPPYVPMYGIQREKSTWD